MNALFAMELPVSEIIVERLGWVLVHSLWQFAFVALLVGITMRAMRTRSAKMRYGVLIVALSLTVAAPVVTVFSLPAPAAAAPSDNAVALQNGRESFAALDESSGPSQLSDVSSGKSGRESERPAVMPSRVSSSTHSRSQIGVLTIQPPERAASWSDRAATLLRPWLAWIVAVWSFGVVICSLRPLLGWHMLWRLKHVGVSPVSDEVLAAMRRVTTRLGVRYTVRVLQSTLARVPVVVGYVRPVILLPVSLMTSLPTSQLEAILAHELAHVMRHDFVVNLLQTLVETLFFYHPAVWWMSHQLRIEREHCCDDLVVELLGNRVEYGRALVAVAELRGKNMLLAPGATDGSLLSRLRRIVGATRTDSQTAAVHQNNRWPVALACLLSMGLTAAVSTNWNATANEKPEPPEHQVSSPFSDASAIAGQFLSAMTQLQLPYLDDLKLQALSKELHDSIVQLNANPISAERRAGLIKGVAEFVKREFNPAEKDQLYLEFRNRFETLKWELRIALSRSEPTPTGMSQLMKQREWIRAEVAKLEEIPKFGRTHRSVVAQIETLFDDPLNPFFNEPMSESNFTQFQKQLLERVNRYPADRALIFAAPAVLQVAMDVLRDELLQKWPIRNVGYQRHDLRWSLNVTPQIGNSVLGLCDLHTHTSAVYLDVMKMIFVTDEAPQDLAARNDWLQQKQQGDLAFDAKSDTLVGVRGAKLAVLNASDWYTADQISLAELRDIVEKTGKDAIPFADFVEQDGDPAIGNRRVRTPSPSLAIKTNEGQFAVVRLWSMDTDGPLVKSRPRPLPPNPPLHPGDVESQPDEANLPNDGDRIPKVDTNTNGEEVQAPLTSTSIASESASNTAEQRASGSALVVNDRLIARNDPPNDKIAKTAPVRPVFTRPINVSGRALDEAGKPVAGARIYIASLRAENKRLAETKADANGRYQFRNVQLPINPIQPNGSGRESGAFEIFGSADGKAFAWRPSKGYYPERNNDENPGYVLSDPPEKFFADDPIVLDLTFTKSHSIKGRFVDEAGKPVVGVKLAIRSCERLQSDELIARGGSNSRNQFESLNESDVVPAEIKIRQSDADGVFEFTGLPGECRFWIDGRHSTYPRQHIVAATTSRTLPKQGGVTSIHTSDIALTLLKVREVPVKVLFGDTGLPAAKVFVSVGGDWKETDANGLAKLRLPAGEHFNQRLLPARGTRYLMTDLQEKWVVGNQPPAEPFTLRLRPAVAIDVTIVDADTGRPLANVDLWTGNPQSKPGEDRREVTFRSWEAPIAYVERPKSDQNGKLRILVEPGEYRFGCGFEFRPDGYQPDHTGQLVICRASQTAEATFKLKRLAPADQPDAEANNDGAGRGKTPVENASVEPKTNPTKAIVESQAAEPPPKEYGPKDWAGWFVSQVSYRKQKDGSYPAVAFKHLRKKVTEDLSDEPNAPGVDEARAWLDATAVDKNWGAADFEAMVERIGKWRLAIIQRALGAEEAASRSFPKPGRAATPEELKGLSFGPAAENGLRVAWVLDPAREEYKVGDDIKCRVVFHNSGTRPVQFAAWDVQDGTWTIRDAAGKALKMEDLPGSNVWTYPRVAAYQRYRLNPGQVVEVGGHGVGIGAVEHSASKSQIPIWRIIHAQAGDSVRISVETKLDISVRFDEFPEEQARDWTGTLRSGELKFRVVAATDANRQQPIVLRPKAPAFVLPDHLNLMAVGFDREGKELVSVATEHDVSIRHWDVVEKKLKKEVKLETDQHGNIFLQTDLTLSGDRRKVIAIEDPHVGIWDTQTGKVVQKLTFPKGMPRGFMHCIAATPDLSFVACSQSRPIGGVSSPHVAIVVWDVASGKVVQSVRHDNAEHVHCVALSHDGKWLASGGQRAGTCIWDVSTGKLVLSLPNSNPGRKHPDPEASAKAANQVLRLAFSPDGQRLVLGDMLGVKLVDVQSGELQWSTDAPLRFGMSALVFSKDGKMLARTDSDKTVPIWSTQTGKLLAELPTGAHDGDFSDDGKWFAVGFTDGKHALAVWRLD